MKADPHMTPKCYWEMRGAKPDLAEDTARAVHGWKWDALLVGF